MNIKLRNIDDALVYKNLSVIAFEGVALISTDSQSLTVKFFPHCFSDPLLLVPHYLLVSTDKPIKLGGVRIYLRDEFILH